MTDYKIEKGVPLGIKKYPFPFKNMEVGDSFIIDKDVNVTILRSSISYFTRINPSYKFATRKESETYRCWRVS